MTTRKQHNVIVTRPPSLESVLTFDDLNSMQSAFKRRFDDSIPQQIHRGFLYATGIVGARHVNLPIRNGATLIEDLEVGYFFPQGAFSIRLVNIPGTNFPLPHHFRIYVSQRTCPAPVNECILDMHGVAWAGNILIFRYNKHEGPRKYPWMDDFTRFHLSQRYEVGYYNLILDSLRSKDPYPLPIP
ncbi:hypothetical protein BKA70DRAFT_1214455 [Coprinopsis sp. MPI-PUGE-AT-0042]|nr:hypothetical protein BKA70DRAFT_1214455 [Coprinopsis sp. MPI-PUGE-AT-0042]